METKLEPPKMLGTWTMERRLLEYLNTVERNPWIANFRQPHARQRQFLLLSDVREVFFGGQGGGGKALAVNTPIPTPSGWSTMGELKSGDQVFGMDGKPCAVLCNSGIQHNRKCYKITFDDGSETVADAEHLWLTYTADELSKSRSRTPEWRAKRRSNRPSRVSGVKSEKFTLSLIARNKLNSPPTIPPPTGQIRTTTDIAATVRSPNGRQSNHAIPISGSLDCPESPVPLDPYLLGVWLGDGTASDGSITSADLEIPAAFESGGFKVVKGSGKYRWGTYGLHRVLRLMGLLKNKRVPSNYLRASRSQRLALLQGLMDTDGYCCKSGSVEFCNTNRNLADGVFELVASLGCKPHFREGVAKLYGRIIGPKYTVKWTTTEPMFRLQRKLDRQKVGTARCTTKFRYIVSCEEVDSVAVCCIKVDSQGSMFLHGRAMIPTHNSEALWLAALQYVSIPTYAALILRRTYADLAKPGALMDRSKSYLHGTDAVWNETKKQWKFPSGATISFGHLENEEAKYDFASAEFQFVAFDELTHFTDTQYTFLFTRLRKNVTGPGADIPLRMRSASNPGARGHQWVKKRFVDPKTRKRDAIFLPATMDDNPTLNKEEYVESLKDADKMTREQIQHGNWDAIETGQFKREWFRYYRRDDSGFIVTSDGERFLPSQRPVFQTCDPAAGLTENADNFVVSTWCISPKANLIWLDCFFGHFDIIDQLKHCQRLYRMHKPLFFAVEEVLNQRALAQVLRRSVDPMMVVRSVNPQRKKKAERSIPLMQLASTGRLHFPEDNPSFPREEVEGEFLTFTGEDGQRDDLYDSAMYACSLLSEVSQYSGGSDNSTDMIPGWYDPHEARDPYQMALR